MANNEPKHFYPNGVHLRADYLTLEFMPGKPMFRSTRRKTKHLEKMGIRRRDGHFLFIEEALYLSELGAAVVVDQKGNGLSIAQLYALMAQMGLSLLKYAIFAQFIRAGYLLRRPFLSSKQKEEEEEENQLSTYPIRVRNFRFPRELLDKFPCIYTSPTDSSSRFLLIPSSITAEQQQKFLFSAESKPLAETDLVAMNEKTTKSAQSLLKDLRCCERNPWECYRPRHWPSFHSLSSAESWPVWALRREKLMSLIKRKREIKRRRKSEPDYDFDVFAGDNLRPTYRLLIVDQRFPPGHPNFGEISRLASDLNSSLLIVTGTPTNSRINQFQLEDRQTLHVPIGKFMKDAEI